jgi:phosphoribosylglycinamide formyltransferase-1
LWYVNNSLKQTTFVAQNQYMHRLAIFASGEGSNAQKFIEYFKGRSDIGISLIVCNNKEAGVINKAKEGGIQFIIVDKDTFYNTDSVLNELKKEADFIVLAGFLWMVPDNITKAFSGKMVNSHPALLPK